VPDEGFDFRERREAKRFEPPPWEREQFEELARKRAEEEADRAQEAEREVAPTKPGGLDAAAGPEQAAGPETGETTESEPAEDRAGSDARAGGVEDARLNEMLADLAIEEIPSARGVWKVSVAVGGIMVAFGAVFLFWGIAALVAVKKTGAIGTFGGSVLLLFGIGFVSGGVYLVVKNLRQQGVL
jgi:hypothetical protein